MRNLIFGMSLILSMIGFNLHAQDLILKQLYMKMVIRKVVTS